MYFKFILFRVYKIWLSIKKKDQWLTIFTQHIEDNIIIHQNQHFVSSSKKFFFLMIYMNECMTQFLLEFRYDFFFIDSKDKVPDLYFD